MWIMAAVFMGVLVLQVVKSACELRVENSTYARDRADKFMEGDARIDKKVVDRWGFTAEEEATVPSDDDEANKWGDDY